jgi:hypothetical protein
LWWWNVRPGGDWDMKHVLQNAFVGSHQQMQNGWFSIPCADPAKQYFYDVWGNIWFGFVGAALGFDTISLYMQGQAADIFLSQGKQIVEDADIYTVMAGALLWRNNGDHLTINNLDDMVGALANIGKLNYR